MALREMHADLLTRQRDAMTDEEIVGHRRSLAVIDAELAKFRPPVEVVEYGDAVTGTWNTADSETRREWFDRMQRSMRAADARARMLRSRREYARRPWHAKLRARAARIVHDLWAVLAHALAVLVGWDAESDEYEEPNP